MRRAVSASARPLVLASSAIPPQALQEIAIGLHPRLDYLCIADALGAEVLDTSLARAQPAWRRNLERTLATDFGQAEVAWRTRQTCSAWLSTSEKVGLPLALRGRAGPPHVLIAHNLTTARKRGLHRLTRVLDRFDTIVCLSETQATFLRDQIGFPAARVRRLWDNVDDQFFRLDPGEDASQGEGLLAVGRENRDYATLIEAARLLDLPLTIVASSLWSTRDLSLGSGLLPPCVTVLRDFISYPDLRALYAKARLVVVPLHASSYAAGVNGALEAMAMGKASVVTRSPGLEDYLQDDVTQSVVPPADPHALADAVTRLWNNVDARRRLGAAARCRVEAEMGMDRYACQIADIVRDASRSGAPA